MSNFVPSRLGYNTLTFTMDSSFLRGGDQPQSGQWMRGPESAGLFAEGLAIQDGGLVIGKDARTGHNRQRAHRLTVGQSRRFSRFRIQPPSDLALLLSSHGANSTTAVSSQGSNF